MHGLRKLWELFPGSCRMYRTSGIREQTIYYIQTHLDEELNRIKVASALYLNPDYLDRRFKKEMGCSVNRYILREQVNMAKGLLLNPKDFHM